MSDLLASQRLTSSADRFVHTPVSDRRGLFRSLTPPARPDKDSRRNAGNQCPRKDANPPTTFLTLACFSVTIATADRRASPPTHPAPTASLPRPPACL